MPNTPSANAMAVDNVALVVNVWYELDACWRNVKEENLPVWDHTPYKEWFSGLSSRNPDMEREMLSVSVGRYESPTEVSVSLFVVYVVEAEELTLDEKEYPPLIVAVTSGFHGWSLSDALTVSAAEMASPLNRRNPVVPLILQVGYAFPLMYVVVPLREYRSLVSNPVPE